MTLQYYFISFQREKGNGGKQGLMVSYVYNFLAVEKREIKRESIGGL
jgi:hypothetical protein